MKRALNSLTLFWFGWYQIDTCLPFPFIWGMVFALNQSNLTRNIILKLCINHSQNPVSISSFASFSRLAFLSSNSSNDTIDNPATFRFKLYLCQSPTKIWHYKELLSLIDCFVSSYFWNVLYGILHQEISLDTWRTSNSFQNFCKNKQFVEY